MLMEYDNVILFLFHQILQKIALNSLTLIKVLLNQITPEKALQINEVKIFQILVLNFLDRFNFIRKGFYYLIESMRLLENENIRLDLRTNIPSYLDIKKIPKNINLISNHISKRELEYYYNNSDLVILPSVDEGFGMVALEAMCLKKPVLVTKNVGMKDILTKYLNNSQNYIIQPEDIEVIRKIFELSKNKTNLRQEGELFFEAANKYLEKDTFKGYTNL